MSTSTLDIQISPELLASLGKSMYSGGFFMTVVRELIQNSIDADSTKISVSLLDNTRLTVIDNGRGIKQVDGLLNVIGGAYHESASIGGFGLAKIAIFACEFWEFKSTSGTFSKGFNYNDEDRLENGTRVTCDFLSKDIPFGVDKKITSFLSLIDRDIEFTFNGLIVEKSPISEWDVNGSIESITDLYLYNGYIVVRVNGMPTFQTYVNTLEKAVIFDYFTTLNPYHDNYPLTTNRDSFKESTNEFIDFKERKQAIENKLHTDKQNAELISVKLSAINFQGNKYISSGPLTVTDYKKSSRLIYTYKRYILQIADLFHMLPDDFNFGLCDGSNDEDGFFKESNQLFCISNKIDNDNKGKILAVAMHEFCHCLGYTYHNEDFSSALYRVNTKVTNAIFAGTFRK